MPRPLATWIAMHGGVAHTRTLRDAGFSPHDMAHAVGVRSVDRVRRSWLIAPSCAPDRRAATRMGGRLTCVSEARRLDLWTPAFEAPHVAVMGNAARFERADAVVHWAAPPVPIPRIAVDEPVINVLFHVARCLPRADALAVWESALRTRAVDCEVLARVRWGSTRASAIASLAGTLSDSGLESHFIALMRPAGIDVRQQVWIDGHPVDGLIGERLAIQIDGFAHHQAGDRRRDIRADTRLSIRGYTVLRFDYVQILFEPDYVVSTVLTAIAQGLHLRGRR